MAAQGSTDPRAPPRAPGARFQGPATTSATRCQTRSGTVAIRYVYVFNQYGLLSYGFAFTNFDGVDGTFK